MVQVICNEDEGVSWFATTSIEAGGIGAFFHTDQQDDSLDEILTTMKAMTEVPLSAFNSMWFPLQQTLEDTAPEDLPSRPFVPSDTSLLVPGGNFNFTVTGNAIECFDPFCPVDVQFAWEDRPHRRHSHQVEVASLWADQHLVTDAQFAAFLVESGWMPSDQTNFLRHWVDMDDPSISQRPVIWVSAWDAAACCAWRGARLPSSWEWQWLAQGQTGRGWPWGDELDDDMMPPFTSGPHLPLPEAVGQRPEAAAWSGLEDLVGSVYQWTDVFTDLHTSR